MPRRVDVRAGVRAHDQLRHVRAAAVRDALDRLQLELGVPGVGGNACGERHAHVQEFGYASHKPVMISPPRAAPRCSDASFLPRKSRRGRPCFPRRHGFDLAGEVAYHQGDYSALMRGPPERLAPNERLARWRRSCCRSRSWSSVPLLMAPHASRRAADQRDRRRRIGSTRRSRREGAALVTLVGCGDEPAGPRRISRSAGATTFSRRKRARSCRLRSRSIGAQLSAASALMYVRAERRDAAPPTRARAARSATRST